MSKNIDEFMKFSKAVELSFDIKVNYVRACKEVADKAGLDSAELIAAMGALNEDDIMRLLSFAKETDFVFPGV